MKKGKVIKTKYKIDYKDKIKYAGRTLYRIIALVDFDDVKKGEKGGYVGSYKNLSQKSDCWIFNNAKVFDNATVKEFARVYGEATVCGNALVTGCAEVFGNATVKGRAVIYHRSKVFDNASVSEDATTYNDSKIFGYAHVRGNAKIYDNTIICGNADIHDNGRIGNNVKVCEEGQVGNCAILTDKAIIKSFKDYQFFHNNWSSGNLIVWTRSNNKWSVGCFKGTGKELILKAYKDNKKKGDKYKELVEFCEKFNNVKNKSNITKEEIHYALEEGRKMRRRIASRRR